MTNPICIDLSHHNPTPDWHKLKAGGVVCVIMKATEGTTFVDKTYHQRRADAEDAGLMVFTYHFLKHGNVDAQMQHYLTELQPKYGERVVVDFEDQACTIDDLINAVHFLEGVGENLQVTVYGASFLTDAARGHAADLGNTSLWAARYSTNEPNIATDVWPVWSLWQYTDHATVDGISQPVDASKWNGTPEAFVRWVGPANLVPSPVPDEDKTVELSILTPPGVLIDVWVNNEQWRKP